MSFCRQEATQDQRLLKEIAGNRGDPALIQLIRNLINAGGDKKTDKDEAESTQTIEEIPPLFPEEMPAKGGEVEIATEMESTTDAENEPSQEDPNIDEHMLRQLQEKGMIQVSPEGEIRVTSRGARALARLALREILEELARRQQQLDLEKVGYGASLQPWTRRYILGDSYENVNVEKTLLNSLTRKPERGHISLYVEDFEIHEPVDENRVLIGLLIDESRSMHKGDKLRAAVETSMALSELVMQKSRQELARRNLGRVFFTTPNLLGQVVIEDYLKRQDRPLWKQRTGVPTSDFSTEMPLGYPYVSTSKVSFWNW